MSGSSRPRIALVVNPASGRGRAARLVEPVAAELRRGADVEIRAGRSATESAHLLESSVGDFDAVVVLGGDGLVHLAVQALAETDTPLGIIPGGTGNDSAATLGLPTDPITAARATIEALHRGEPERIDLGRTDTGRWWFGVLYCGFDSAANARADRMRWPRGPRRYDLAIVAEMLRLHTWPLQITMDGQPLTIQATLVAVGNSPRYGGGKMIAPHAEIRDGRFGITVVGRVSRLTLGRLAPTLPSAGHIGHPAVSTHDAVTVTIDGPDCVAYADGELISPLPVTTTCVPSALAVLSTYGP